MQHGNEDLDQAIVRALGRAPRTTVPGDFAQRVASALPASSGVRMGARRTSFGRAISIAGIVLLCAAMLWLTPRTRGGDVIMVATQCALCLEATCLMLWLTVRWRETN